LKKNYLKSDFPMPFSEAVILAGGLGTRLQGVLPNIAKCMAPINGEPLLAFILDYLESQGINKVILSVGHHKDQIINYFGRNYNSIEIVYAIESELLGTGGATRYALGYCTTNEVFIVNGDTYFTPDLDDMKKEHSQSLANITIAVIKVTNTDRYGMVELNETNRITAFREKEQNMEAGWINGGIYLINRNVFDNIALQKFSLERDFFKASCPELHIQAFKTNAFFLDIGIPEDYANAQTLIPETKVK